MQAQAAAREAGGPLAAALPRLVNGRRVGLLLGAPLGSRHGGIAVTLPQGVGAHLSGTSILVFVATVIDVLAEPTLGVRSLAKKNKTKNSLFAKTGKRHRPSSFSDGTKGS